MLAIAQEAGVAGWASNATYGTVHVHLEGPPDAVERVVAWARQGPRHARVDQVIGRPDGLPERRREPVHAATDGEVLGLQPLARRGVGSAGHHDRDEVLARLGKEAAIFIASGTMSLARSGMIVLGYTSASVSIPKISVHWPTPH